MRGYELINACYERWPEFNGHHCGPLNKTAHIKILKPSLLSNELINSPDFAGFHADVCQGPSSFIGIVIANKKEPYTCYILEGYNPGAGLNLEPFVPPITDEAYKEILNFSKFIQIQYNPGCLNLSDINNNPILNLINCAIDIDTFNRITPEAWKNFYEFVINSSGTGGKWEKIDIDINDLEFHVVMIQFNDSAPTELCRLRGLYALKKTEGDTVILNRDFDYSYNTNSMADRDSRYTAVIKTVKDIDRRGHLVSARPTELKWYQYEGILKHGL